MKIKKQLALRLFSFTKLLAFSLPTLATGVTPPPVPVPLDPVSSAVLIGFGGFIAKKIYQHYK